MWEIIEELCSAKGVSLRQVALAIGVAPSTLGDIRRGSQPRNKTLRALADYFGVSVDYLMGIKKEDTPSEEDALDEQLIAMLKKLDPAQTQRVLDPIHVLLIAKTLYL